MQRASQGEKRQLPRHPHILPISVAGSMHPTIRASEHPGCRLSPGEAL